MSRRTLDSATPIRHLHALAAHPLAAAALTLVAALAAAPAQAAPTPKADLKVDLVPPAVVPVSRPATYAMTVTNLGGQKSGTVTARVKLPLTRTSPQVWVLGSVTNSDSRCQIVSRELVCTLAALPKNYATTVYFQYTAPVSSQPLQLIASASSPVTDPVAGNNTATVVPNLVYPSRTISPSASTPFNTRLCTGTTLTAFEECLRYPSSITGFPGQFAPNQLFDVGYGTAMYGTWSQNTARTSLKVELYQDPGTGAVKVGEFNGWAVNDRNCFEGLTTHVGSSYVSPYEICMP